jgi:hypothetical protein
LDSKGTGLTLMLGVVVGVIGYFLWQNVIGFETKVDDVGTILQNAAAGSVEMKFAAILIAVGLAIHGAGLLNTRGTAPGTSESLGIFCIITAILIWIITTSLGLAMVEMGEKYVAFLPGAQVGDPLASFSVVSIQVAGGFIQSATVAANTLASLLAGIGWVFVGCAYRGSNFKGAISFLPLGWLAMTLGLVLIVVVLAINPLVSIEVGNQIGSVSFLLIVLWSVSAGLKFMKSSK